MDTILTDPIDSDSMDPRDIYIELKTRRMIVSDVRNSPLKQRCVGKATERRTKF